jgi:hypothetical protein
MGTSANLGVEPTSSPDVPLSHHLANRRPVVRCAARTSRIAAILPAAQLARNLPGASHFPGGTVSFPVIGTRFPDCSLNFPCYAHQGKAPQTIESSERKPRKIRPSSEILGIFPVFSRKTGKNTDETGSYVTASATTHSCTNRRLMSARLDFLDTPTDQRWIFSFFLYKSSGPFRYCREPRRR